MIDWQVGVAAHGAANHDEGDAEADTETETETETETLRQRQTSGSFDFGTDSLSESAGNASERADRTAQPPSEASTTLAPVVRISKALAAQLNDAALYRDARRWAFLYKVIWRWHHGDRAVASPADIDGARLHHVAKAVRRDKHDMIAYVRFRQCAEVAEGEPEYIAWYEPAHDILAWGAEQFAQRMGSARWLIATPSGAASWDGATLHLQHDHAQRGAIAPDAAEALWLAYYRSTFNPARLNETALHQHMPVRYWKGLPEGPLIPEMISAAKSGAQRLAQAHRVGALQGKVIPIEAEAAQPMRAAPSSLAACRRCELWQHATQPVNGEGPANARIMLLGEQPGDQEDLSGRPFVGPAGQLLDEVIERAGLARGDLYLTNAVKHFKWTPRGKRRIHKTPAQREVEACAMWLEHEVQRVQPEVIVTLGATALGALLGKKVSLQSCLGKPFELNGMHVIATYHPSFALRRDDAGGREQVAGAIRNALAQAAALLDAPDDHVNVRA
ncbi:DUF4130 domain-containing protein [Paraburkholderia sp. DHOC27]|nr:DUF4130 domain-containing protein [Paraburkholderia sp. DHOC27]